MDSISDFEDMLRLLAKHRARYLVVGGLAFIYHAKPRSTKDMDLWVDPSPENVERVNRALAEFGSPAILQPGDTDRILQIGVAPNRIDVLTKIEGVRFETAWRARIRDLYGDVMANWISLNCLIRAKSRIDDPRHQDDARILRQVRKLRGGRN